MSLICNVHIFGVYLVLEIHICKYSHTRRFKIDHVKKKKKINCPASVQRICVGGQDSAILPRDTLRGLTSPRSHPGMLEGLGEGVISLQNETEAERRENSSEPRESGRIQEEGLKMEVKGRDGEKGRRVGNHVRVWERFGWGNTLLGMCYSKPGVANSAACRSKLGR